MRTVNLIDVKETLLEKAEGITDLYEKYFYSVSYHIVRKIIFGQEAVMFSALQGMFYDLGYTLNRNGAGLEIKQIRDNVDFDFADCLLIDSRIKWMDRDGFIVPTLEELKSSNEYTLVDIFDYLIVENLLSGYTTLAGFIGNGVVGESITNWVYKIENEPIRKESRWSRGIQIESLDGSFFSKIGCHLVLDDDYCEIVAGDCDMFDLAGIRFWHSGVIYSKNIAKKDRNPIKPARPKRSLKAKAIDIQPKLSDLTVGSVWMSVERDFKNRILEVVRIDYSDPFLPVKCVDVADKRNITFKSPKSLRALA